MTDARQRHWPPWAPAVAMSALLVGLGLPGCGDPVTTTTTAAGGAGGAGGGTGGETGGKGGDTGGTGGIGGTGGDTGGKGGTGGVEPTVLTVETLTEAPGALDATPDSTGLFVYFTASRNGDAGVFKVSGVGGAVTDLVVGAPLVAPLGVAMNTTDTGLFVADAGWNSLPDDPANPIGAILKVGTSAGAGATLLDGTAGFKPRGLDITKGAQGDVITFTGVNPVDGAPGVFSIASTGGAVTTVVKGAPLVDPSGVAVGKLRTFVTDTLASDGRQASLLVIEGGVAKMFVPSVGVGYPAGVALSEDELKLYVSGIDPSTGLNTLLVVDALTAAVTKVSGMGVDLNTDAAGLHRARNANIFSWADSTAGAKGGSIFKVSFK